MPETEPITRELIMSMRSEKGGWSRQTLTALGVEWPPKHGWIDRIIGNPVDSQAMAKLKIVKSKHQRLRDVTVFQYDDD